MPILRLSCEMPMSMDSVGLESRRNSSRLRCTSANLCLSPLSCSLSLWLPPSLFCYSLGLSVSLRLSPTLSDSLRLSPTLSVSLSLSPSLSLCLSLSLPLPLPRTPPLPLSLSLYLPPLSAHIFLFYLPYTSLSYPSVYLSKGGNPHGLWTLDLGRLWSVKQRTKPMRWASQFQPT